MLKRILAGTILIVTAAGAAQAAPALKPTHIAARIATGQGPCFGDVWVPLSGGSQVVRFHVG